MFKKKGTWTYESGGHLQSSVSPKLPHSTTRDITELTFYLIFFPERILKLSEELLCSWPISLVCSGILLVTTLTFSGCYSLLVFNSTYVHTCKSTIGSFVWSSILIRFPIGKALTLDWCIRPSPELPELNLQNWIFSFPLSLSLSLSLSPPLPPSIYFWITFTLTDFT